MEEKLRNELNILSEISELLKEKIIKSGCANTDLIQTLQKNSLTICEIVKEFK